MIARALLTATALSCFAGCKEEQADREVVMRLTLKAGEQRTISIEAAVTTMVSFEFDVPISQLKQDCPFFDVEDHPEPMQLCGRMVAIQPEGKEEYTREIESLFGGGLGLTPTDGIVSARITNLSREPLDFLIYTEVRQ